MKQENVTELNRTLGFWSLFFCSIGVILGAGIYVLIGKAAGLGGNAVWLSFGLSALLAAFTGLSYAELVSMFPKSSAEYGYTKKALGERTGFVTGVLIILASFISAATVAVGFAGYFSRLFNTSIVLTAVTLIIILSLVLMYGIKESAIMAVVFTLVELLGLVIVIFVSIPYLGSVDYLDMPNGFSGVLAAAALIFFAYIGFEEITRLGEETKKPEKVIPKVLLLSILISTILYMLVAVAAVSVLNWQVLGASKAPLAEVVSTVLGEKAFLLISVIALFATANTVLFIMLAGSRIIYGMAVEKVFSSKMSYILKNRKTPAYAILVTAICTALFAMIGDIGITASLTDFAIFAVFIIINVVVIVLRYKEPYTARPFRVPVNIGKIPLLPLLGILTCFTMLFHLDFWIIFYGLLLIISLFFAYEIKKKYFPIKG
ncbi:MAG: amino acid permease [Nanoarchaeota archaeon]|nr:amino acid permease [Nanoarchaeota archaeon]